MASSAATTLAGSIASAAPAPERGRVVRNMTGGEVMAELLVDWKVPYVFGLGGSEEVGFLDAIVDRLDLQYVHGLHEGSVMSMADGYARATGDVPILNFHSVAVAAYSLGPMVNAFKDRIPLVVTVGRQSTDIRGTNAFLESVNLHQRPQEYTQWSWDVMSTETIPEVVRRAFVLAQSPPGGPTFLTFSKDLWEKRVDSAEILPRERSRIEVDVAPNEEQVRRIADMLVAAEFPVIAVGKEGARFDPSESLMELAELLGAPVFQDIYMAHGPMVFPSTHPHYSGMFRQDPSYPAELDLYWALGGTMFGFGVCLKNRLCRGMRGSSTLVSTPRKWGELTLLTLRSSRGSGRRLRRCSKKSERAICRSSWWRIEHGRCATIMRRVVSGSKARLEMRGRKVRLRTSGSWWS